MTRKFAVLVAAPLLMMAWQIADASQYTLLGWYQRSSGGTLSSLLFKTGAAQGCVAINPPTNTAFRQPCYNSAGVGAMASWLSTNGVLPVVSAGQPVWNWNGTTLSMTGTLWATSSISSNPQGTPVISDRITNLSETPGTTSATALSYTCYEGTFLSSVGANGCLNVSLGTNGVTDSTATYNIGGNADCMTRTLGGDDASTGNPRGLTTRTAGGGCDATDGAAHHFIVVQDDANFLILSNQTPITNDGCFMFQPTDSVSPCAADVTLASASYFVFIPDADGDSVRDAVDNCPSVANADQADTDTDLRGNACDNCRTIANNTGAGAQCDTDGDSFGNRCDGDFGNPAPGNGATNAQDYAIFRPHLGISTSPTGPFDVADLNCNGTVNAQDYAIFRPLLGTAPGPGAGP